MITTKLQLLLLLIVVLCFLCSIDTIEPNVTFKWPDYINRVASDQIVIPDSTSSSVCVSDSGIQGITSCKVASDACYNDATKLPRSVNEPCMVNNISGTCQESSNKLVCMVDTQALSNANQTLASSPNNTPVNAPSGNVYVIQKGSETKTHSAACEEQPGNSVCDNLITTAGTLNCNGPGESNCCLCNSNPTKWNKVYTSKYGDTLQHTASKSLQELPTLFANYALPSLPANQPQITRSSFNVLKLTNNNYGVYTNNQPEPKRFFKIKDYVNNEAPDDRYYTPSKGYFLNNQAQVNFDISQFPGYITSSSTSQLLDTFYHEQCLYSDTSPCSCPANHNPDPQDNAHSSNRLCRTCPAGQITNPNDPNSCVACSEQNKVFDTTAGSCQPCLTVGANDRRIYRTDASNVGTCPSLNNVTNGGVVRSDCVPKTGATVSPGACNVLQYSDITAGSEPLYHLSNDTGHSISEYYTTCTGLSGGNCQVVQSLIGDSPSATIESYVNFNGGQLGGSPAQTNIPASGFTVNSEMNMITNEYCRQITEETKCNQLKQCNWSPNTSSTTSLGSPVIGSGSSAGTCLIDPTYNTYTNNSNGITYHYIPIPEFKPTTTVGDTHTNHLTTQCSSRPQAECTANNKCHWTGSTCVSYCTTKTNQNDCNADNICLWDTTASPPSCSEKTDKSCGVPSITTTDRYKLSQNLGQSARETDFNSYASCKGLLDSSTVEYSGDARGVCFSGAAGSSQNVMEKTGCIPSTTMNNLTMYKSTSKIAEAVSHAIPLDSAGQPAQSDPSLPNSSALTSATPSSSTPPANELPPSMQISPAPGPAVPANYGTASLFSAANSNIPNVTAFANIQSASAIPPYSDIPNAPIVVNRCRELCIKNSDVCDDFGIKFPTEFNSTTTDNGCYLMKKSGTSQVTATIEVIFEAPIEVHYGVKYYPCTVKLKKNPGQSTLPDNIKNVVGIVGTSSHPLYIPYIYRLYGNSTTSSLTKTEFSTDIPGLPDTFSGYKISGQTAGVNPGSDTVKINLPNCKPSSPQTNDANNWNNNNTCYATDPNINITQNMTNSPAATAYINARGGSGTALESQIQCLSTCITVPNAGDVDNIKQFKLGATNDDTFIYQVPLPSASPSITDIATLIPGSTVNGGSVTNNVVWGNITASTSGATAGQKERAAALIYPNKIENITNGGIIKKNHNRNESQNDIEIMKLYVLEGSPFMKFNLIGKRLEQSGTARADWSIVNITLPISTSNAAPRSYTIDYPINDISTCVCPNGTPSSDPAVCTTAGSTACATCDTGFHVDGNHTCQQNTCTCTNGTPATGTACTTNNTNICATCNVGYTPNSGQCVATTCTCSNGIPAIGSQCVTSGEKCTACSTGYHPVGDSCVANTCTCTNGPTAATGANCTANGADICAGSCNPGFTLSGTTCSPNLCTCANGVGKSGTACPTVGPGCISCSPGYTLRDPTGTSGAVAATFASGWQSSNALANTLCNTPGANCVCESTHTCTCTNGTPATGPACPSDGPKCSSCNVGYHPVGDSCVENVCSCPGGGTGATGTDCPSPGAQKCASCTGTYVLSPDHTDCGTLEVGSYSQGIPASTPCNSGYYPVTNQYSSNYHNCMPNICTCVNGQGAQRTACPTNGNAKCVSCSVGYHLDGDSCVANVCSCPNGTAATGNACTSHNAVKCSACTSGFTLGADSTCS